MHPDYLPMNAAALMDRVFDLYRATFKTQIAFSLIIGIISFVLMTIFGVLLIFGVGIAIGMAGNYPSDIYIIIAVLLIFLGIAPLYMCWLYISSSGHILISKQAFYGELVDLPFRETLNAFLRVMSAAIAHLLLSAPWFILLFFIIYAIAGGTGDLFVLALMVNMNPVVIILAGLAFTLLYVVYSNLFALSIPVAIFENRLFFSTVTRSWGLLKGSFWQILGLRILWALLIYLFSYSAQGLVVAAVGLLAALAGQVTDFGYLWFATGPLQFYIYLFVAILVGPMEGIMTALIYFNQKIKKDGLDIEISLYRLQRSAGL